MYERSVYRGGVELTACSILLVERWPSCKWNKRTHIPARARKTNRRSGVFWVLRSTSVIGSRLQVSSFSHNDRKYGKGLFWHRENDYGIGINFWGTKICPHKIHGTGLQAVYGWLQMNQFFDSFFFWSKKAIRHEILPPPQNPLSFAYTFCQGLIFVSDIFYFLHLKSLNKYSKLLNRCNRIFALSENSPRLRKRPRAPRKQPMPQKTATAPRKYPVRLENSPCSRKRASAPRKHPVPPENS